MFGMTSKEFWEDDPQLYWSYRISFMKKMEMEQKQQQEYMKYNAWLNGNMTCKAVSISLHNAFSKGQSIKFPTYDEMFEEKQEKKNDKKLTNDEIRNIATQENNMWARF